MSAERRALIKRGLLFLLIGLTVFLIYLYFFVGIKDLIAAAQRTNPVYYSLAITALFLSATFYSLTWQHLLHLLSINPAFRKTFSFVWIGTFVDLMIPAESLSGEVSKIYLMSKNTGEDAGKVAASVVSHRVLTMTTTLIGIIIGSAFLFLGYETSPLVINSMLFVAGCTVTALFLIYYLSSKPLATNKLMGWILRFLSFISKGRWKLDRFRSEAQKTLDAFHQGMKILGERPKSLVLPFLFSIAAFLLDLLISFLVFISMGFQVSWTIILIVYTISNAIQTIPLGILGEFGVTDILMTTLYTLLGIPIAISAAVTVLTRVLTVWLRIFVGYVTTQWIGIKVLISRKNDGSKH